MGATLELDNCLARSEAVSATKSMDQAIGTLGRACALFSVTQSPREVPDRVLAQLGNRVQQAPRAFTVEDGTALKAIVSTIPRSSADPEQLLAKLGIGKAAPSDCGIPTPVEWTRLRVPQSRLVPTEASVITEVANGVALGGEVSRGRRT